MALTPLHAAELGLEYLGVDVEPGGVDAERLEEVLAGRQLAAITALGVIERLARPGELLTALADMANRHAGAPLVISVANVSHFDLAAKLLSGRWDVSPAGLLDEHHLSLFAPGRLEAELSRAGWKEIKADDFVADRSDQHFPDTLTALSVGTPLHDFLLEVREQSAPGALVNHFVRAYLPAARPQLTAARLPGSSAPPTLAPAPFLSVVVRTQGRRLITLEDNLTSLAAQTDRDIEVIICCHDTADSDYAAVVEVMERLPRWLVDKTRAIRVDGGGRARPLQVGVEKASGRYVAFLDDDDLALCHWVEEFAKLVKLHPGAVVRAGCATHTIDEESWECGTGYSQIGSTTTPYPLEFDLVAHLVGNRTPNCSVAIPRSCFTDLGMSFDDELAVLEDWDMLLNAALLCGVASTPEVTSLYRRWKRGYASHLEHPEEQWEITTWSIRGRFDSRPLLVPPGTVSRLTQMEITANKVAQLEKDLDLAKDSLASATTEVADLWVEKGQLLARVEAAEKLLAVAEQRAAVAKRQTAVAERQVKVAERQAAVAEQHVAVAEQRVAVAEQGAAVAVQGTAVAVQGVDVAEQRAAVAEDTRPSPSRAQLSPSRARLSRKSASCLPSSAWPPPKSASRLPRSASPPQNSTRPSPSRARLSPNRAWLLPKSVWRLPSSVSSSPSNVPRRSPPLPRRRSSSGARRRRAPRPPLPNATPRSHAWRRPSDKRKPVSVPSSSPPRAGRRRSRFASRCGLSTRTANAPVDERDGDGVAGPDGPLRGGAGWPVADAEIGDGRIPPLGRGDWRRGVDGGDR